MRQTKAVEGLHEIAKVDLILANVGVANSRVEVDSWLWGSLCIALRHRETQMDQSRKGKDVQRTGEEKVTVLVEEYIISPI